MLLVIVTVCIVTFVVGMYLQDKMCNWAGDFGYILCMFSGITGVIAGLATVILFCEVILGGTSDMIAEKITMYELENAKIEDQIETIVEDYMEYESDIFEKDGRDVIAYVSLYPDLKSDELVQSQIDIYVQNNQKIKELKEYAITSRLTHWWLYFGE